MADTKKRTPRKPRPVWERAFKAHVLWRGREKLGRVALVEGGEKEGGRYAWEAAGRSGRTDTLAQAKQQVELAVMISARQLPLFE